jgi:hypothetical protein
MINRRSARSAIRLERIEQHQRHAQEMRPALSAASSSRWHRSPVVSVTPGIATGLRGMIFRRLLVDDKQSLPILIRVLDQVKLRIRSTPSQFALAQDALRRPFRSLERNLVLSHLVDGPALAGKEFHPSNI